MVVESSVCISSKLKINRKAVVGDKKIAHASFAVNLSPALSRYSKPSAVMDDSTNSNKKCQQTKVLWQKKIANMYGKTCLDLMQ